MAPARTENGPTLNRVDGNGRASRTVPANPQTQTQTHIAAAAPPAAHPETAHVAEKARTEAKGKEKPKTQEKKEPKKD